jgi:branched-chain amino acid transport system ATP-binding protein
LCDQGITILMIEQNAKKALQMSDHGIVLQQGRLVLSGTAREVLDHPGIGHLFLGGAVQADGGEVAPRAADPELG